MKGLPAVLHKTVSFFDERGKVKEVLAGCYVEVFPIKAGSTFVDSDGKMRIQREETYAAKFLDDMFDITREEFSVVI